MITSNLVSIVLPCYKMGKFIPEALESIGRQTYQAWEVIAVDDCGPEDGTRAAVKAFAANHPEKRVEFLQLPENRGVSGARNAGAAAAKGDFLAFLDPDDRWLECHLQCHLAAQLESTGPIVTTSRVGVFTGDDPHDVKGEWGYSAWEKSIFPHTLAMRNVINPSTVLIPAKVFIDSGGFDENRALQHTEDWDLWIRLVERGVDFLFLDQLTGLYRRHEGGATADRISMRKRVQAFSEKNHSQLFPDLGLATWMLSKRVDALEARLNWLQRNPLIRLLSLFQRLLTKGR